MYKQVKVGVNKLIKANMYIITNGHPYNKKQGCNGIKFPVTRCTFKLAYLEAHYLSFPFAFFNDIINEIFNSNQYVD